jgi:hypothetical protein
MGNEYGWQAMIKHLVRSREARGMSRKDVGLLFAALEHGDLDELPAIEAARVIENWRRRVANWEVYRAKPNIQQFEQWAEFLDQDLVLAPMSEADADKRLVMEKALGVLAAVSTEDAESIGRLLDAFALKAAAAGVNT